MSPEPIAYFNGQFLPYSQTRLPLHDAGFVFGATITDLCRTFRHRLFRLADHVARFRRSAELTGIPLREAPTDLERVAERLVAHNVGLLEVNQELVLVMFATPGAVGHYLGQTGDRAPTLGMHTYPLAFDRYRTLFRDGACLVVPPVRQVAAETLDPNIKQRSRLHWWLAGRQAEQKEPGSMALLLDGAGNVTETAVANFLLVRKGTVLTPPCQSVLRGISLEVAEGLCRQQEIPFREEPLTLADCQSADEAMLSSTTFCLAGVRSIDGTQLPWPGSIYRKLLMSWDRLVGLDVAGQFLVDG